MLFFPILYPYSLNNANITKNLYGFVNCQLKDILLTPEKKKTLLQLSHVLLEFLGGNIEIDIWWFPIIKWRKFTFDCLTVQCTNDL